MTFKLGKLHRILYKPRETFEDMKPEVEMQDGIIIGVILIAIGSFLTYGVTKYVLSSLPASVEKMMGASATFTLSGTVIGLVISLITLFISALFAGWIASSWESEEFNKEKSIALIGYSTVLDLVQNVVTAGLIAAILPGVIEAAKTASVTGVSESMANNMTIISIVGILFFIWALWIKGTAIAVANKTTTAKGIVSWFVAAIIITLVAGLITAGAGAAGVPM